MKKILWLLVALCVSQPTYSGATDDFETWNAINLGGNFSKDWKGALELQGRFVDNVSRLGVTIVRPSIGYNIDNHFSVWAGYLMQSNSTTAKPNTYKIEQDAWQGLTWTANADDETKTEIRNRLEERFLPDNSDISYRWRTRFKAEHQFLNYPKWSIIGYDEMFVTLNNNINNMSLQSGPDQNRLYVGFGYKLTNLVKVEAVYQYQHVWGYATRPDQNNNIIETNLAFTF